MTDTLQTLLGFDYGKKRIGIAVGQTLTGTASPVATLNSENNEPNWNAISQLFEQWKPHRLIVGLPLHADGSENDTSKAAKRFGNQLQARYNLPLEWVDERLSSHEAEQALIATNKKYSKDDIDQYAAKLILESWLQQNGFQ